jgi:magnesium-transporting ATPase (P-type)
MKDVAEAVLINSSAAYVTDEHGVTKLDGNPTELGVFKYLIACGFDMSNEHKDSLKRSCEFITPFDSKKKFSTVCYKRADGSYRVVVKGAPDVLSLKCTRIERSHGNFEDLSESQVADIMGPDVISKFAAKCYRTILTAYKDFTAEEWALYSESHNVNSKDDVEKISAREGVECNLTISSIFGIEDPLRDNIKDTISKLRKSGVRTRMCTGDNVETARSICEKAGIIVDAKDETDPEIIEKLKDPMFVENRRKYECMTGEDFRKEFGRKNEELDIWEANPRAFHWKTMIIPHLKCLARSSPTDK